MFQLIPMSLASPHVLARGHIARRTGHAERDRTPIGHCTPKA